MTPSARSPAAPGGQPVPQAESPGAVTLRAATPDDASAIAAIVAPFAQRGMLLPRTEAEVRANAGMFGVSLLDGRLVGCGALHQYGPQLGEIRSLAVREGCQRHGIGARLAQWCLARAAEQGMERVFTLTYRARFFERLGFERIPRAALPEKIWSDCARCPKAQFCDEIALITPVGSTRGSVR